MKKAAIVMATLVAFLLSGPVFAARKYVDMPSAKTMFKSGGTVANENGILKVAGNVLQETIPTAKGLIPIKPTSLVPVANIAKLAKSFIRGPAGLLSSIAFSQMLDGVDWVMHDGAVVKKPGSTVSVPGLWTTASSGLSVSSPSEYCNSAWVPRTGWERDGIIMSNNTAICSMVNPKGDYSTIPGAKGSYGEKMNLTGQCPSGSSLNTVTGACTGSLTYAPIADSDLSVLDGFIKGKDGTWQRDLSNDMCKDNEECYTTLTSGTQLSGPLTVVGTPTTQTTTSPSGSTTTTTTTPTSTLTYGPNYFDYGTTTTTTTTNGTGTSTSTDDTDISFPVPPDIFGPANGGLSGIKDEIPKITSSTSAIPYMAWYSFSQSCSEISFQIPVYGTVTTAICPIYRMYIWPVLYFFFAVFTWLHCFQIWRGTVMRVRAS